jgi:hypothetical protein
MDWLEEIEGKARKKKALSEKARQRIEQKRLKVAANFQKNGEKYLEFIAKLNELVKRVNNLPEEERAEFIEINSKYKTTEFDNHLYIFSSSKKVYIEKFKVFILKKKKYRFKYARIIYFDISKEIDKVEIEIKEKYIPKGHRRKHKEEDINKLYKVGLNFLTPEFASQVISWLAFKNNIENLTSLLP